MYFRKSNPFVISGPFWEHDGSLGTLEISWDVPGHPEDNVGLNSLCGWDLCKMQLKTESKDMATLRGHHWIYVRLMLKLCCSHFISQCYPKEAEEIFHVL